MQSCATFILNDFIAVFFTSIQMKDFTKKKHLFYMLEYVGLYFIKIRWNVQKIGLNVQQFFFV